MFTHASRCYLHLSFDLLTTRLLKKRCNLRNDRTRAEILDETISCGIGKYGEGSGNIQCIIHQILDILCLFCIMYEIM